MWCSVLLLLLSVNVVAAFQIHSRHPKLPHFLLGRPPGGFLEAGYKNILGSKYHMHEKLDTSNVKIYYFTQLLDNFDPQNKATWKQRIMMNKQFYQNNNLAFVMIGGESAIPEKWVANEGVTFMRLAKKYGAAVYQVEHRFFGDSRPFKDTKTEHLKYCTIAQALADLAHFIKETNRQEGYKKWVAFGGSYPGSLAAWFRREYPDLTVGAVASSAPIQLVLDFYGYAMVVEKVLNKTNPACYDKVFNAFHVMEKLSLTANGRQRLSKTFNLSPPFEDATVSPVALQNFITSMFAMFQGVIQYTYDGRDNYTTHGMDAAHLCTVILKAPADPLQQMRAVMKWLNGFFPQTGPTTDSFWNSYWDMINVLRDTTYNDLDIEASRGWMWLSCNQLGVLQTTDQGKNAFGRMDPLNYYLDFCTDMFGEEINITYIRKHNSEARDYYRNAADYNATNVVLPNGAYDPWHVLGTYKSIPKQHQTPILIQGAAHCSDMYPPWSGEPKGLVEARKIIDEEVHYFISNNGKDPVPTYAPY